MNIFSEIGIFKDEKEKIDSINSDLSDAIIKLRMIKEYYMLIGHSMDGVPLAKNEIDYCINKLREAQGYLKNFFYYE